MIRSLWHSEAMPSKLLLRNFASGHYYHLRHQAKKGTTLFLTDADYQYFILLLSYYLRFPDATPLSWVKRLTPQTVISKRNASQLGATPTTLHAFLLLPDHFHLLLRENVGTFKPGISNLMRRLSVGYAMYSNKTHGTTGTIYQGKYKMIDVPENSLSALINSLHHHMDANDTYLSSSLHGSRPDYFGVARPWLSPLPVELGAEESSLSSKILLE
ncbi:MAG: hypothetical protein UX62_C0005G0006 [Microgenomates group bacterium GW2011_GWA2_46_7]|nr:MAG: hypothetical protein UX62_C0005G0006 [Microgenomates group bacterium GW2011_GWA2_46_7]